MSPAGDMGTVGVVKKVSKSHKNTYYWKGHLEAKKQRNKQKSKTATKSPHETTKEKKNPPRILKIVEIHDL